MIEVLALDLEGTLISNIVSQFPRPYLQVFLLYCQNASFEVVLYTAANFTTARKILRRFDKIGWIPPGMGKMPIVQWEKHDGSRYQPKNLQYVQKMFQGTKLHNLYLVDDIEGFVALGQRDQWIPIMPFNTPYASDDDELLRVRSILYDLQKGDKEVVQRGYHGFEPHIIGSGHPTKK